MLSICLYLQAHQPCRIKNTPIFNLGESPEIEDNKANKYYLKQVLKNSYLPSIRMLNALITATNGDFRFGLSITGTLLEQIRTFFPAMFLTLSKYLKNGYIELIAEPYYHSLASFYSREEFGSQVGMHEKILKKYFDKTPSIFRNAELAYRSDLSGYLDEMGYQGIIIEGSRRISNTHSIHHIYDDAESNKIRLLLRDSMVSSWFSNFKSPRKTNITEEAKRLISLLSAIDGDLVVIGFDLENMGEHHNKFSGIFTFIKRFVKYALKDPNLHFINPTEALEKYAPAGTLSIYSPVTWHGNNKDLSAWNGNILQKEALKYLYNIEEKVKASGNIHLIELWRKLQSTDHLLYLSTEEVINGKNPAYFSPFESSHDAFVTYMNGLAAIDVYADKLLSKGSN